MTHDPNCLFCKIIAKQILAKIVHEDAEIIAFEDINPQAPVHTLIVPKRHIADIHSMTEAD
ncbi:MAG TPA: HIT domain-containing protein, partial [Nitrospirota bacterium]